MGYIIASNTIGKCSRAFTLATNQVLDILEALNDEGATIMTVTHDPRVGSPSKKSHLYPGWRGRRRERTSDGV